MKIKQFLENKKGGEKYLSVWWFFILAIIGVGIVAGIYIFYYADIDVKEIEADILANRMIGCLVEAGSIKSELLSEEIFDACYLNKEAIEKSGKYYLEIKVYDAENCKTGEIDKCKIENETSFGVQDLKTQCQYKQQGKFTGKEKAGYFAGCSGKYVYALNNGNAILLYVYAGSNQQGGALK